MIDKYLLIKQLQDYKPIAASEVIAKERIVAFIKSHEDCFERSLSSGHITASAWLINKDKTKALLMHHARLDKWLQPGGHCDGDSNVLNVAIREAQEESGIHAIVPLSTAIFDVDVHLIPATKGEKEHYHYDIGFLLHVVSDEGLVSNNESKDLRWFGKKYEELPEHDGAVRRKFTKWLLFDM